MYVPSETAKRCSDAGAAKTRLPVHKTLILAVFAGMFIALGAFGSQVALTDAGGGNLSRFFSALIFPTGLLMVVMAGAELFTGNNLIILSVLNKQATVGGMLRNWILVYCGNFAGSLLAAFLMTFSHAYSLFDGRLAETAVAAAQGKVALSFQDAFLKAILCNMLVCTAVWISFAAEDAAGKIIGLYMPILLFVLSGFEHCVANMYIIPAGILLAGEYGIRADNLSWTEFLAGNLLPVTLGNMVGGVCVIGLGYFFAYLNRPQASK